MDYKTQYTILKRLLQHHNGANANAILQDILNDQDFIKLNEVFFQIYTLKIDKNNTLTNIYDLYNLQIFDLGIDASVSVYAIGRNDWVRTLTLVDLFEKVLFHEEESTFEVLNNVVLVKGASTITKDYEQISHQQGPLSQIGNKDLVERYELLHEFVFLSFTVSCYKNFLILDDANYKEFENLLELNALKLIASLEGEVGYLSALEEMKQKTLSLETPHDGVDQVRDDLETELRNILAKSEAITKQNTDLETRLSFLKDNFNKILNTLPELPETEDLSIKQIQQYLQKAKTFDLDQQNVSNIKTTLDQVWQLLRQQKDMNLKETDQTIRDLNDTIDKQRKMIHTLKRSESENVERKTELELSKKSGLLQNEALRNNILQEYALIRNLEDDYIKKISDLHAKINKVDLKKYVSKFIELEETITMMDSEILEKEL